MDTGGKRHEQLFKESGQLASTQQTIAKHR